MEIVVKVGIAKKIGMPNYGSYQASCYIDCPANIAMTANPDELEAHIAQLYRTCVDAVNAELENVAGSRVVKSQVPQPEAEKPKASVFGLWLKDKAIAYGLDMAALTGLLYREVCPNGVAKAWTDQGKELAGIWDNTDDRETAFDAKLTKAFESLESTD